MAALRNKKTKELELDRIAGTRLTLETQVRVLCSGAAEQSRLALSTGAICSWHRFVLVYILIDVGERPRVGKLERRDHVGNEEGFRSTQGHSHKPVRRTDRVSSHTIVSLLTTSNVDKVDATMDSIREQMDLTNEISDAISNPVGMGNQVDEVCSITFTVLTGPPRTDTSGRAQGRARGVGAGRAGRSTRRSRACAHARPCLSSRRYHRSRA